MLHRLPVELVHCVVDALDDTGDRASLACCSRGMRHAMAADPSRWFPDPMCSAATAGALLDFMRQHPGYRPPVVCERTMAMLCAAHPEHRYPAQFNTTCLVNYGHLVCSCFQCVFRGNLHHGKPPAFKPHVWRRMLAATDVAVPCLEKAAKVYLHVPPQRASLDLSGHAARECVLYAGLPARLPRGLETLSAHNLTDTGRLREVLATCSLRELTIDVIAFTDDLWDGLAACTALRELSVRLAAGVNRNDDDTRMCDALAACTDLRALTLDDVKIDLGRLYASCTALRQLDLHSRVRPRWTPTANSGRLAAPPASLTSLTIGAWTPELQSTPLPPSLRALMLWPTVQLDVFANPATLPTTLTRLELDRLPDHTVSVVAARLVNLRSLKLNNNRSLTGAIARLSQLVSLDMDIGTPDTTAGLATMQDLRYLDITVNYDAMPLAIPVELTSLAYLRVTQVAPRRGYLRISSLPPNVLALDLSRTYLDNESLDCIRGHPSLRFLDISDNDSLAWTLHGCPLENSDEHSTLDMHAYWAGTEAKAQQAWIRLAANLPSTLEVLYVAHLCDRPLFFVQPTIDECMRGKVRIDYEGSLDPRAVLPELPFPQPSSKMFHVYTDL